MNKRVYPIAFLALFLPLQLHSATINVPADQPTIQAGIDASSDGDIILVSPGTYTETISIPHSLVILSTLGSGLTFLQHPGGTDHLVTVNASDSGSLFEGFTISGVSGNFNIFQVQGTVSGFAISENRILNCDVNDVIRGGRSATIHVNYNLFKNCGVHVIASTGPNCTFVNNTVDSCRRGLAMFGANSTVLNNIIVNNTDYSIAPTPLNTDYNNFWNNGSANNEHGPNGFSLDPMFVDPSANNYTLTPTSPCIDAGHPDPIYLDRDLSRNDMGAFPSGGGTIYEYPLATSLNLNPEDKFRVVNHIPTFYWTYFDTSLTAQMAYEIEVGTDTSWTIAEIWAPGTVNSTETFAVFAGTTLMDGVTYYYRIRVNDGTVWGGWTQSLYRMHIAPPAPVLLSPINGFSTTVSPRLLVSAGDSEPLDEWTYDFEVYSDVSLSIMVDSHYAVEHSTSPPINYLTIGNEYWWIARASDGKKYSNWSAPQSFFTTDLTADNVQIFMRVDGATTDTLNGLDGALDTGVDYTFTVSARNGSGIDQSGALLGWMAYSPDNSITTGATISNVQILGLWGTLYWFNVGAGYLALNIDGILPEQWITGGSAEGAGFSATQTWFVDILSLEVNITEEGVFCIDSAFYPPAGVWTFEFLPPDWLGGGGDLAVGGTRPVAHCYTVSNTCCEVAGDFDNSGAVTIGDVTAMIFYIFRGGPVAACCQEADANRSGQITIGDVTYLLNYIFGGGPAPICGPGGMSCSAQ